MNWERFRLLEGMVGDLTSDPGLPRHTARETFLRGPIPWSWIARASRLDGPGFAVAVGVWYLARRFRRDVRASVPELAEWLGPCRASIQTGLRLAEGAALIAVQREPGCKLVLNPATLPIDVQDRRSLRGPIPWDWWQAATRLPGPSLRVGAVCWTVAGWRRSAEFVLDAGDWSEWSLSRFAVARGLRQLDDAGLITARRRPKASPVVTIQAANPPKTGNTGMGRETTRRWALGDNTDPL